MKRDKLLTVRMTKAEMKAAQIEAGKAGISVSDLIRLLLRQFHNGIRFEKETKIEGKG